MEHFRSNPRAWTWISDFLRASEQADDVLKPTEEEVLAYIAGLVGEEQALAFVLSRINPVVAEISAADILSRYRIAFRHAVRRLISSKRLADLALLVDGMINMLDGAGALQDLLQHDNERDNLATFLNDIPADLRQRIYRSIPALKAAL